MQSPVYDTEIARLEASIRKGYPDLPPQINRYFQLIDTRTYQADTKVKRAAYLRAFHMLLDTVCDTYIPYHWRCICLDNIYKPLFALQQLSTTPAHGQQIKKLYAELSTSSHFFMSH